jgi:tryptophan synthase alpha chain
MVDQAAQPRTTPTPGRIGQALAAAKRAGRPALMPFIPGGYPDLAATAATISALERAGATLAEVGFPFSDPIADGPTIQAAFTAALAKGLRVADVFDAVRRARSAGATLPLVAMVSYSIVFRYGADRFFADAKGAGVDGMILPDLPPPEAATVCGRAWAAGLDTCLLVAPSTPPARRAEIARLSTGFVYYLSVAGVTGARDQLPADLAENLAALKQLSDRPVCVGFGVHTAAQVAALGTMADGAIVGSAMVRRMGDAAAGGAEAVATAAAAYCRQLLGA